MNYQSKNDLSGKDVQILIGGQDQLENVNEVWASSDLGKTWSAINVKAPFAQRDAFNGEITKDGLIIIAAGLGDRDIGIAREAPINDVWVNA